MNKYVIVALAMLLTACASQQEALKQCPSIGVDIQHPDFFQNHSGKELADFYACAITNTKEPLYRPAGIMGDILVGDTVSKDSMSYQVLLWSQVVKHEKTPAAAQEAWMIWQNSLRAIRASENAAAASRSAASAANRPVNCMNMGGGMVNCQ